jgi:ribosome maturation factor RimP
VSRAAEIVLDDKDPIPGAYALEVSSPGIERKLKQDKHFLRYIGHNVRLRLYAPINNRKNFRGKLTGYANRIITLTNEESDEIHFDREAVAVCRLAVFDE